MKPVKLAVLCAVLAIAGCGDKDETDTAKQEQGTPPAQTREPATGTAPTTPPDDAAGTMAPDATAPETATPPPATPPETMAPETAAPETDPSASAGDTTAPTGDTTAQAPAGSEPGTSTESAPGAAAVAPSAGGATGAQADVALGQSVYEGKCKACHATGAAGAPKLEDKANWAPRIAQGIETLDKHAIEGFKGKVGFMPPKGGFATLTDDEVKAAVAYMVSQAQ